MTINQMPCIRDSRSVPFLARFKRLLKSFSERQDTLALTRGGNAYNSSQSMARAETQASGDLPLTERLIIALLCAGLSVPIAAVFLSVLMSIAESNRRKKTFEKVGTLDLKTFKRHKSGKLEIRTSSQGQCQYDEQKQKPWPLNEPLRVEINGTPSVARICLNLTAKLSGEEPDWMIPLNAWTVISNIGDNVLNIDLYGDGKRVILLDAFSRTARDAWTDTLRKVIAPLPSTETGSRFALQTIKGVLRHLRKHVRTGAKEDDFTKQCQQFIVRNENFCVCADEQQRVAASKDSSLGDEERLQNNKEALKEIKRTLCPDIEAKEEAEDLWLAEMNNKFQQRVFDSLLKSQRDNLEPPKPEYYERLIYALMGFYIVVCTAWVILFGMYMGQAVTNAWFFSLVAQLVLSALIFRPATIFGLDALLPYIAENAIANSKKTAIREARAKSMGSIDGWARNPLKQQQIKTQKTVELASVQNGLPG